ncbi:hypothetical protein MRX96_017271 [Rhipicephalus microplus]
MPTSFAMGIYEAIALTNLHYALPLGSSHHIQWHAINSNHRRVLHVCHGLFCGSRVAATLAQTCTRPTSLTGALHVLFHI